ncbi:hypothetical protein [Streptomyces sp. NPDC046925]|uniref:hypothetical protein n=1 Tax=Streptomyces sp. NPDC046925 TaxID=3155375 RepID=UPI0033D8B91A
MTTTTSSAFESIISRHGDLIATLVAGGDQTSLGEVSAEEFIDKVDSAVHFLGLTPFWSDDREAMSTAHAYLSDAFQLTDGDPAKSVLIDKASDHLDYLDADDFIC